MLSKKRILSIAVKHLLRQLIFLMHWLKISLKVYFATNQVFNNTQGQWSLQVDATEKIIQIKSFKWPGAFFYHALGQANYANFYYGTGQKNNYVGLMLN